MPSPGFAWRWGLRHPVQSVRAAYLWERHEAQRGRLAAVLLTPYSWLVMAGLTPER
jgi:hypothetical protein